MSLKEIINQLRDKEADSKIDPIEVNPKVRAGVEAIARNAKEAIEGLRAQYERELEKRILLISVTGPGAKKFSQYARDKMKVFAYDHTELLDFLTASVKSRGGLDSFGSNEGSLLLSEVLNLKTRFRVAALPNLRLNDTVPTPYGAPLEEAIQRVIEFSYGIGLYDAVVLRAAQAEALKEEFSGNVLPIVVYNYRGDENTQGALLPPPSFKVEAPFNVSVNFVKEELLKVKEALKNTKTDTKEKNQGENNE